MKTLNICWNVSLSDGSNYQEGKGEYQVVEGERSPWLRLLSFLDEKKLTITSLSLRSGERVWNLPSLGKNPKFKAFMDMKKPIGYRAYRKMGKDIIGGVEQDPEIYTVAEADYGEFKLQIWVDEKFNSWTLII